MSFESDLFDGHHLADETTRLLRQAQEYAQAYVRGASEQRVYPSPDTLAALAGFDESLPTAPRSAEETLELLHRLGSPATVPQIAGRYFGFVDGGAIPVGMAARWLADSWDQNAAQYVMSPIAGTLETICERWLADILSLPEGTAAGFETGTCLANLSGLVAGRDELLRRAGWNVGKDGLYGAPAVRVVVGGDAHAAVRKTLALLGLGYDRVEIVPADDQGRMRADALPKLDDLCLVVTQAGNVNSGAFDPVGDICDAAHDAGAWVHVDGAFGLWAGASPNRRHLYEGVEKADSWAVDAHKTLNVPYDCGIVLCRSREALTAAFQANADYLIWSEQRDGMSYTPSMSRRARGVELWAVLRTLGRTGIAQLVDQLCERAKSFADQLAAAGFTIHNDVVFNQVLISCGDNDLTLRTLERVQDSGECWCGGSQWKGHAVMRVSVCSWATTEQDVARSVVAFVEARKAASTAS